MSLTDYWRGWEPDGTWWVYHAGEANRYVVETPSRRRRSWSSFQDLHGPAGQAQSHDAGEDSFLCPTPHLTGCCSNGGLGNDLSVCVWPKWDIFYSQLLNTQLPKRHNQVNVWAESESSCWRPGCPVHQWWLTCSHTLCLMITRDIRLKV